MKTFYQLIIEAEEIDFPLDRKINYKGIPIEVENSVGSMRKGKDKNGETWSTKMIHNYGRIKNTIDNTGDMLDVYLNSNKQERDISNKVYIVNQINPETKSFDEVKVMIGFLNIKDAQKAYLIHYNSSKYFGNIHEISLSKFKEALMNNIKNQ